MATTVGPDIMIMDRLATENRDFEGPAALENMPPTLSPLSSPELSPRSNVPPPNPPFVFPPRQSPPSSYSRAARKRPGPILDFQRDATGPSCEIGSGAPKPVSLPDFSFPMAPPSGGATENSFLSPPQSPQSPRAIPSKPVGVGHRRGGSEFVGGSIRAGDSIAMISTSPTKSESGLASPNLAPSRPRRGHAHRRSAAISSHDLSSIILPSPTTPGAIKGSSAPTSPALYGRNDAYSFPRTTGQLEQTHSIASPKSESDIRKASTQVFPSEETQVTPKPPVRNRVGFSDTLEFIPRPLSLVSSDTSSTATARPGHSVSGSISSVISLTTSTIADREAGSHVRSDAALKRSDSRPSTAGAVLERTQSTQDTDQSSPSPRRRNSIPHLDPVALSEIATSTPSPSKAPKRWSFFGLDPFVGSHSPTRSRPVSASSLELQPKPIVSSLYHASDDNLPESSATELQAGQSDKKPIGRKRSKKQKKVKTWAGSILSRKSKPRHVKPKRRTPTPPPQHVEIEDDDMVRRSFEILAGQVMPTVMITDASALEGEASCRPSYTAPAFEEDAPYPMIDLDAALGPFNTPLPRNAEWEAAQKAGGLSKRQLHSAAGMSRFTGPGMHYFHRRAESAPEMVPFEAGRFIHRFGSSSTMADVFEEDEEDGDSDINKTTGQSTPIPETPNEKHHSLDGIPSGYTFAASNTDEMIPDFRINAQLQSGPRRKGSDLSDDEKSQASSRMKSEHGGSSLYEEVIVEENDVPPMPEFEPRFASVGDAYDSPAPSPRHIFRAKDLAPVDVSPLHLPTSSLAPISPYSMSQASSFPSPRSPASYDAHRISTAPSSVAEDTFQSLLMGEPGPEVRISVDDIPSLTSSNSTMTRESASLHNPQARPLARHNQPRPASFTATAFGRRRSSLASLNRLISTSHGERSKLSMEVPLDGEPEKKPKVSKTKRLSRMMQFWKPKENTPA